jgi:hypothetical protein
MVGGGCRRPNGRGRWRPDSKTEGDRGDRGKSYGEGICMNDGDGGEMVVSRIRRLVVGN